MNQWLRIRSRSPHRKAPPALPVPTISTSLMRQKKLVLICPIHAEPVPAPPARASCRVALWINRIRASWTTNRSQKALPCFAWLTQQAIAKSKEKQKKSSELNSPIFELRVQGLPLRNNQGLFPFLDQLHSIQQAADSPRLNSPSKRQPMSSIAWCEPLPWRSMQPCRERPSAQTIKAMFKRLEIAQPRSAVAGDASSHHSPELQPRCSS